MCETAGTSACMNSLGHRNVVSWVFQHSSFYTIWHCRPQVRNNRKFESWLYCTAEREELVSLVCFLTDKKAYQEPNYDLDNLGGRRVKSGLC